MIYEDVTKNTLEGLTSIVLAREDKIV